MKDDGFVGAAKKTLKSIVSTVSPELTCKILFFSAFHRKLDLNNPQTLDEKLCTMKIGYYDRNPLIKQCADKYRVRDYVKSKGLNFLLNECYGVYDSVSEIPWQQLPEEFVLKCNHGCGYNIICPDKSQLNIHEAKRKLRKWMREDYWRLNAELNYKVVSKKILCEKYLKEEDGSEVVDYKIYCFHGKPFAIIVCVERAKHNTRFYFFDKDWNLLRINPDSIAAPDDFTLPKPACVEDMLHYAEILSEPFPFVRVDFYVVADRVVFGELTFTPASGMDKNRLPETDILLGKMLTIPA